MNEIYVSTDIETDGQVPAVNSMLSFGSAAYFADKTLIGTFTANLETLPGAEVDPRTMDWWKTQPVAWKASRENLQSPALAMPQYVAWIKALPGPRAGPSRGRRAPAQSSVPAGCDRFPGCRT